MRTQSPGPTPLAVGVEQPDVDRALDAGDVDLGEAVGLVDELDDLARDGQAHARSPPCRVRSGKLPAAAPWHAERELPASDVELQRCVATAPIRGNTAAQARRRWCRQDERCDCWNATRNWGCACPRPRSPAAATSSSPATLDFEPGCWEVPSEVAEQGGVGYLVLEGVLAREMILAGTQLRRARRRGRRPAAVAPARRPARALPRPVARARAAAARRARRPLRARRSAVADRDGGHPRARRSGARIGWPSTRRCCSSPRSRRGC